jgi:hypothetical protein
MTPALRDDLRHIQAGIRATALYCRWRALDRAYDLVARHGARLVERIATAETGLFWSLHAGEARARIAWKQGLALMGIQPCRHCDDLITPDHATTDRSEVVWYGYGSGTSCPEADRHEPSDPRWTR